MTGDSGLDPFAQNYLDNFNAVTDTGGSYADPNSSPDDALAPPVNPIFTPPALPPPTPPPPEIPLAPLTRIGVTVGTGILRGLLWFLFPQPTGPRENDELDPFDVIGRPPPPTSTPPTTFAPDMPPNWDDIANRPWDNTDTFGSPGPALPKPDYPVEMPDGLTYFPVTPPQVTPRDDIILNPGVIELPDFGDYFTDYRPGPAPSPTSPPGIDPVSPDLFDIPEVEPRRPTQPDSPGAPAPDVLSPTLPDGFGDPIGDPFVTSPLPTPPRADPRTPANPGDLPDFLTPGNDIPNDPLTFEPLLPLTQFKPDPFRPNKDDCDCAKKKKKKKKKDRKDRSVCYRGTYYETKRGLSKVRTEQVPCADKPPKKERKAREKKPRKPKLKPGQFPGLGLFLIPQP